MLVAEGGSRSSESNIERFTPCDRSTAECGTPGMLKSMFSSLIARLNSLSALNDAMSRFSSGANCSFTMCVLELLGGTFFLYPQKHLLCFQVSLIDPILVWVVVGLVGRTLRVELLHKTVERVYRLAVVQLWNPIDHSLWSNCDRVSMRSLVVVEEIRMIFHTRLLQSSFSQLLESVP